MCHRLRTIYLQNMTYLDSIRVHDLTYWEVEGMLAVNCQTTGYIQRDNGTVPGVLPFNLRKKKRKRYNLEKKKLMH